MIQDYFSFGFHWFALFFLISGIRFVIEARRRDKAIAAEPRTNTILATSMPKARTFVGTYASINYDPENNQLTPEGSKISGGASLSIHFTVDTHLDVRNIYDKIELSQEFSKEYLSGEGVLNLSLRCRKVDDRILVNISKYREGILVNEVEEEFELKLTPTST